MQTARHAAASHWTGERIDSGARSGAARAEPTHERRQRRDQAQREPGPAADRCAPAAREDGDADADEEAPADEPIDVHHAESRHLRISAVVPALRAPERR